MTDTNQGYVVLEHYVGDSPWPFVFGGTRIEGIPHVVRRLNMDAIQWLMDWLIAQNHTILWLKHFNGWWPTYHTEYTYPDGTKSYYLWHIYGEGLPPRGQDPAGGG